MPTYTIVPQLREINPESSSLSDSVIVKRDMAYRVWRTRVGTALLDYGLFDKEAFQFNACSEHPISRIKSNSEKLRADAATVWVCGHNISHDATVFMPTCDLRICPDCAARQTARLAARYIPKAIELTEQHRNYKLRHIVFTTPLALTSDTPEQIQKKLKHYSSLPQKALELVQKQGVEFGRDYETLGCIQSAEFGSDGLKLHFHVIQFGAYVPQKLLVEAWRKVTNLQASIVYIRGIDASTTESIQKDVIETLKYSVKFWSTNAETGETDYLEPNIMPHLLRVLKGVRRVKSWGVFYKLPKLPKEPLLCEECHNEMQRIGLENWPLVAIAVESGKPFKQVQFEQSFLNLRLANKSKKSRLRKANEPPESGEIYRQKDLFKPHNRSHYLYEDNS